MTTETKGKARKSPEWLTRSVIYQIFLRSFTPEGTLKAASRRLPELAKLGVDILYLCPICLQDDDMRKEFWSDRQSACGTKNPKNPYRIKDFYSIDPEYGTDAELHEFVEEAHKFGMRVLLDIVFFHCGPTAVFIDKHHDFVKRNPDGSVFNGSWHFPALNFESPALREYLLRNLEYWIDKFGVDGYRCDVSDAVPLDFWEAARRRIEKLKPEVIVLAEGQRNEDQNVAFDLNYNFTWAFTLHKIFNQGKPVSTLREIWGKMSSERPDGYRFIRYVDNHDIAHDTAQGLLRKATQNDEAWQGTVDFLGIPEKGLPPDSRIDKAWGIDAVNATLALSFTLDGVPFLYNGQEVADTALHSIYERVPVDWSKSQTQAGRARWGLCRSLCGLRHSERALCDGSLTWLDNEEPDSVLSFVRTFENEKILVVVNLSGRKIKPSVLIPERIGFESLLASGGNICELAPFGFFIGKRKD